MDLWMMVSIGLALMLLIGLGLNAWKMLKRSEQLLKDIDKTKVKDLSKDDWDS